jgi:purine-binding chemotaxis protein CheW
MLLEHETLNVEQILTMDILAARKKAAEKAKAASAQSADQASSATEQKEADFPAPAFPPLPEESTSMPNGTLAAPEQTPAMLPENDLTAAAPPATTASGTERKEERMPGPFVSGAEEPDQLQEEQELEMLSFRLGKEEYVVPVDRVREVLTPKEITPVPHTADYLVGVCSLRGTVMPVIDLNRRLGLAVRVRDEKSRIIVVSLGQDDQVGLFVDGVRGVVRFLSSAVRPAPETVAQDAGAEFLKGIARKDDQLYILLDVEKAIGA